MSDTTEQSGLEALGLTQIEAQPLERVLIRQRESSVTTAAWRLELRCDQGAGGIVRIEVSAAEAFYRGDGLFLGWSQERMGQVYETLTRPTGGGSEFELMQLG